MLARDGAVTEDTDVKVHPCSSSGRDDSLAYRNG
jgi:hypothetical protein